LRPGGWLFVNVPALPALASAYDRAVGHLRRYTPASLRAALDQPPIVLPAWDPMGSLAD